MQSRKPFTSDYQRKRFLNNLLKASKSQQLYGQNLLDPVLIKRAETLLNEFNTTQQRSLIAKSAKLLAYDQAKASLLDLGKSVRIRWSLVKALAEQSPSYRAMVQSYGLDERGSRPKVNYFWQFEEFAAAIINGDSMSEANDLPSLGEWGNMKAFKAEYNAAVALVTAYKDASLACSENVDQMDLVRGAIQQMAVEIAKYFDYIMVTNTPERRRDIMRHYGFLFNTSSTSNPEDETPQTEDDEVILPETEEPQALESETPTAVATALPPEAEEETATAKVV